MGDARHDGAAVNGPVVRQAMMVIHGIGEQRPMETLRGFVNAVLGPAPAPGPSPAPPRYYSKPDSLAEGFELRRLVVAEGRRRTDFYEFYWAHLMPIAATDRLTAWFWMLLVRPPTDVPARFRIFWWLSWLGILAAILLAIGSVIGCLKGGEAETSAYPTLPWGLAMVLASLWLLIRAYVGDAAVYLSPDPRNVAARNAIRTAATDLLEKLHSSGRYARIVVVGHSLGSVIGYDMLTYAWQRESDRLRRSVAERDPADPLPRARAQWRAEEMAQALSGEGQPEPEAWHAMSAALLAEQAELLGARWRVSDFVTLGSPLAHGDFLLARNRSDFDRRVAESELPTAPPILEYGRRFSFKVYPRGGGDRPNGRVLHHAALFALTGWTNIYFPCRSLIWGDFVGGPVAPLFGRGVHDVDVATKRWGGLLAHTNYWALDSRDEGQAGEPAAALRAALAWV